MKSFFIFIKKILFTEKARRIGLLLTALFFITFFLFVIFSGSPSGIYNSRNDNNPLVVTDSFVRYTVISAGDAMAHGVQIRTAWDSSCKCHDFRSVFRYLKPVFSNTDLRFINYETTAAGPPYSGYPRFCAPDTLIWFLKDAGFNFFVNANNHVNDKASKGLLGTLNAFERYNIRHTGVFRDSAERNKSYPYILREKGFCIAVLNYTYGTNGLPAPKPAVVNIIDTVQIKKDLQQALDSAPDAVLVLMHWGTEYKREPGEEQKKAAGFLFRNGADVIIGSHPHVAQPIEIKNFIFNGKPKNGLVIWSLGNFIANQRKRYADGGIFVRFDIARNIYTGKIKIDNVFYIPFWVYKQPVSFKFVALPVSIFEKDTTTFALNDSNKTAFKKFIRDTRLHLARDTGNIKEMLLK